MRSSRVVVALAFASLGAIGCASREPLPSPVTYAPVVYDVPASGLNWGTQPELAKSDLLAALDATSRARAASERAARWRAATTDRRSIADVVSATLDCYRLGARDVADELIAGRADVVTWENAGALVDIECRYRGVRGHGGKIEIALARKAGVMGPIAVCFPPGTYVEAIPPADEIDDVGDDRDRWTDPRDDRRYRGWPAPQDLGFLRAPVVVLDARDATVRVPVACVSFDRTGPFDLQRYALRRFECGSSADRLAIALCAGERAPDPPAQLAFWIARNDVDWDRWCKKGGDRGHCRTFSAERVTSDDAQDAARLLLEAGVDPSPARFWRNADPAQNDEAKELAKPTDPSLGLP